jgi:hypothetical protein
MRCFFIRRGHVAAVETLDVTSDEEAIEKAKALFEERKAKYERYEVWDLSRKLAEGPSLEVDGYVDG